MNINRFIESILICLIAAGCNQPIPQVEASLVPDDSVSVATALLEYQPSNTIEQLASVYRLSEPNWADHVDASTRVHLPFVQHVLRELRDRKPIDEDEAAANSEIDSLFPTSAFAALELPTPDQLELIHNRLRDAKQHKLDRQHVVDMLELAAYADVTCHSIEYPLRVSTLDFIRSQANQDEVKLTLEWIRDSYSCRLEIATLAEAMGLRMREYSLDLLGQSPTNK